MAGNADRPVYTTGIGRIRYCARCGQEESRCRCPKGDAPAARPEAPRDGYVRIGLDKKGRRGKAVTLITGLPDDTERLASMAQTLKKLCGAGGTMREGGEIEIQGDHRAKLEARLVELGFRVKRVGG